MAEVGVDGGWEASARRWVELIDAGEPHRELLLDPVVLELCGELGGLRVLDLGCGEGRFSRLVSRRGACSIGVDPTSLLIAVAGERHPDGRYVRAAAEALPFAAQTFDLVVSYVSMIDIPGFRSAIGESVRVLRPGGRLLVANLGFVTASLGWQRDEDGNRLFHRVDRYAEESSAVLEWSGLRLRNWHRPLSAYMQTYLGAGLVLKSFLEPVPDDISLRDDPRFEDWFRVPLFNVMLWEKPA